MFRININFNISRIIKDSKFKILYSKNGSISRYKAWEFEIYRDLGGLVGMIIMFTPYGQDHDGLTLSLTLFTITINFIIYDVRHWDYEKHDWVSDPDEKIESKNFDKSYYNSTKLYKDDFWGFPFKASKKFHHDLKELN